MLTRRTFTLLGATLVSAMACRPSWGARAVTIDEDGPVSPRLVALGDAWEVAGRAYEAQRHATFREGARDGTLRCYDLDAPERIPVVRATRAMLTAADDVFLEPSRTRADVLLKYHVMDDLSGWRVVHDSDYIIAAGGVVWHRILEREAHAFGLDLNYFWLWEAPPHATIDGERNSPKWAAVSRWRTERHAAI